MKIYTIQNENGERGCIQTIELDGATIVERNTIGDYVEKFDMTKRKNYVVITRDEYDLLYQLEIQFLNEQHYLLTYAMTAMQDELLKRHGKNLIFTYNEII